MPGLAAVLLPLLLGVPPSVEVRDGAACVVEDELRQTLPDAPPGTRVLVVVEGEAGQPTTMLLTVSFDDPSLAGLTREVPLGAGDCPQVPTLVGLIVERFVADVPATAWDREVAAPGVPGVEPPPPAATVPPPPPIASSRPPKTRWVWAGAGGEALAGSAFASTQAVQRLRLAAVAMGGVQWGPFKAGGYGSLGADGWTPLALGPGAVWVGGAQLGAGLLGGTEFVQVRAGARGGGGVVAGTGFDTPLASAVPTFEGIAGLDLVLWPARVRLEVAVPLLRPRFTVQGLEQAAAAPPFWVGISVGGELGLDLAW